METKARRLLLDMVKCALVQEKYSSERLASFLDKEKIAANSEDFLLLISNLYALSDSQDMAHIPAEALSASEAYSLAGEEIKPRLQEIRTRFDKALMLSVVRFVRIDAELKNISKLFEEEGIDFIPLKGSVLKFYYKNPKIRTSCDIDILVRESDLSKCDSLLSEKLKYKRGNQNAHDVSYRSESGVHLELHYSLMESFNSEAAEKKLREVWDCSYAEEGFSHLRRMNGEFLYFYHIAHMAKHVLNGGCGIKPYMDIFVMTESNLFDEEKADALLSECGLKKFAEVEEALCRVWFGDGEHNELTLASEEFVFSGGVYGNFDNYIAMHSAKQGSRFKYVLSRIFQSHEQLVDMYPKLRGKRWLTPFYQVRRWLHLIFKKGAAKRSLSELKRTASMDKSQSEKAQDFMKSLELI